MPLNLTTNPNLVLTITVMLKRMLSNYAHYFTYIHFTFPHNYITSLANTPKFVPIYSMQTYNIGKATTKKHTTSCNNGIYSYTCTINVCTTSSMQKTEEILSWARFIYTQTIYSNASTHYHFSFLKYARQADTHHCFKSGNIPKSEGGQIHQNLMTVS